MPLSWNEIKSRALTGMVVLTRDYLFANPSMAAVALQGRSANGCLEWKAANGKMLDEVKRQALAMAD